MVVDLASVVAAFVVGCSDAVDVMVDEIDVAVDVFAAAVAYMATEPYDVETAVAVSAIVRDSAFVVVVVAAVDDVVAFEIVQLLHVQLEPVVLSTSLPHFHSHIDDLNDACWSLLDVVAAAAVVVVVIAVELAVAPVAAAAVVVAVAVVVMVELDA